MTQAILYYWDGKLNQSRAATLEEAAENAEGTVGDAIYFLAEVEQVVPHNFYPVPTVGDTVFIVSTFARQKILALFRYSRDERQWAVLQDESNSQLKMLPVNQFYRSRADAEAAMHL